MVAFHLFLCKKAVKTKFCEGVPPASIEKNLTVQNVTPTPRTPRKILEGKIFMLDFYAQHKKSIKIEIAFNSFRAFIFYALSR